MPFDVTTIDLAAEEQRLEERREAAFAEARNDDVGEREREQATARAREAEQDRRAVARLREEYGDDATLEIGGLTMDEKAWVTDRIDDLRAQKTGDNVWGATKHYYAGVGLVTAPFFDGDVESYEARVQAVGEQPAPVIEYVYRQVDSLSTLSGPLGSGSDDA